MIVLQWIISILGGAIGMISSIGITVGIFATIFAKIIHKIRFGGSLYD